MEALRAETNAAQGPDTIADISKAFTLIDSRRPAIAYIAACVAQKPDAVSAPNRLSAFPRPSVTRLTFSAAGNETSLLEIRLLTLASNTADNVLRPYKDSPLP